MLIDNARIDLRRFFNVPRPSERPAIIADLQTPEGRARVTEELGAALKPWLKTQRVDSDAHVYYLGRLFGAFNSVTDTKEIKDAAMAALGDSEKAMRIRGDFEEGFTLGAEAAQKRKDLSAGDCLCCQKNNP